MSRRDTETLAETFASQGREELVGRFREAYAKAVGAHADLVSFDADRIEAMVQRSAADADGLQWRRALAGVAARELDIDLGAALTHPAVVRAHQLVGAPTYESALAALAVPAPLVEAPVAPAPRPAAAAPPEVEPELPEAEELAAEESLTEAEELIVEAELGTVMPSASIESAPAPADDDAAAELDVAPELLEEDAIETATATATSDDVLAHRAEDFAEEFMAGVAASTPTPETDEPPAPEEFTFEQDAVEVPMADGDVAEFGAVHLGGVASLPSAEEIALRLSEDGLDLLQDDGTIVGRLGWTEIAALEVTVPHGRRRRRNAPRLVVHTAGGSARFEVPGLSGEELQDQVQPLMTRFGQ